jgi:hypothetical protein
MSCVKSLRSSYRGVYPQSGVGLCSSLAQGKVLHGFDQNGWYGGLVLSLVLLKAVPWLQGHAPENPKGFSKTVVGLIYRDTSLIRNRQLL